MKNKNATRLFAGLLVTATVLSSIPAAPYTAQAATTKTVTVTTQKQLDAALKNKNVIGITIKTSKGVTFSIKSADYGKKTLTVNAAKATVTNAADFKALNILGITAEVPEIIPETTVEVPEITAEVPEAVETLVDTIRVVEAAAAEAAAAVEAQHLAQLQ